jgi:hypothetical protein
MAPVNMIAVDAAETDWVEANLAIVEQAFASFMRSGEWPTVDRVQRELDRDLVATDVREALRHRPTLHGETRLWEPTTVVMPLRLLRHLPAAHPLMNVCLAVVRQAVAAYQSDTDLPRITSDDPELLAEAQANDQGSADSNDPSTRLASESSGLLLARAGQLVSESAPDPLGSGSHGTDNWQFEVHGQLARRFRDVRTIGDYCDAQVEIMAEYAPHSVEPTADRARRLSVFVMMPFGDDWSRDVYGLIRRAIAFLASDEVEIDVYRADDIVAPGKITDQITAAIESAEAIVADITGTNPNVMWELGYAQALGKPVVILNQNVADSPFDLRDWRQVSYHAAASEVDERRICDHVREALGLPLPH